MKNAGIPAYIYRALLVICAGLFFSCENQAFLPPYETAQSGEVSASVKSGDLVTEGQEIQLSLQIDRASDNPPEKLEVEILDREQRSLGVQVISGAELDEVLPTVSLTDNQKGLYTLRMRLYDEQDELVQEETVPFFMVEFYPEIEKIEVYPPDAVSPQASGVLIPSIKHGEGTWLRWTMGSDLLARGPYEEFEDGFVWTAPLQEGVYSVSLEVFPQLPLDPEAGYPFQSPVTSEVQFFVQTASGSRAGELWPSDDFRNLLHLRGSLEDSGYMPSEVRYEGNPLPAVRDGLFGYYLSSADAILVPSVTLSNAASGLLLPFTLKFIWKPGSADLADKHIASFSSKNGRPVWMCVTDEFGHPAVLLPQQGSGIFSGTDFDLGACNELAISFLPNGSEVILKWYCGGRMKALSRIPAQSFPSIIDAVFQLGGGKDGYAGFEVFVDEFGIFSTERGSERSEDSQIFRRWAVRNLGERTVLYAEGYEFEGEDALVLSGGEAKKVVTVPPEWPSAFIELTFTGGGTRDGGFIEIDAGDGEPSRLPLAQLLQNEMSMQQAPGHVRALLVLRRGADGLRIGMPSGREIYRNVSGASVPVEIRAGAVPGGGAFQLTEVLITREQAALTGDKKTQSSEGKVASRLNQ
jgi:hypothetical protein